MAASQAVSTPKLLKKMVGLEGFEPPTHGLGNRCSILLSYRPTMRMVQLEVFRLQSGSVALRAAICPRVSERARRS